MNASWIVVLLLIGLSFASMSYMYNYRGTVRYQNLREYIRKAWPIFAPFNCFLYMSTKKAARKPIVPLSEFPELNAITENWEVIKKEAEDLKNKGFFEQTTAEDSDGYYDVGFRTFYKYGWSKFYVNWYGYTHESAKKLCPNTVEILSKVKGVNGAMFTLLPPGSKLTRHCDPLACSFRYQLGLSTPNSEDCFINIDGQQYSWKDGEAFLFDETYIHYVNNNTEDYRLIIMCDIERPMNILGRFVNSIYKVLASATVVPNTSIDKRGFFNKLFAKVTPIIEKGQALKKRNRPLYKVLKHSFNLLLFIILLALISLPFSLFS